MKRFLGIFLSAAMCMTCIPASALAEEKNDVQETASSQIIEETYLVDAEAGGSDTDTENLETPEVQIPAGQEPESEQNTETEQEPADESEDKNAADEAEDSKATDDGEDSEAAEVTEDSEAAEDAESDETSETAEEPETADGTETSEAADNAETAEDTELLKETDTTVADDAENSAAEEDNLSVPAAENTESSAVSAYALEEEATYKIYLPAGYDEEQNYPTVYLMPYDGYDSQKYVDDGIQDKLDEIMAGDESVSMVVVMPDFEEGDDYRTMLDSLVADVENKYSVIEDAHYRAILGVNVGGYMAYETALISESGTFFAVGSHMGDFTSENNPYLENGAILDVVNSLGRGSDLIAKHYYYLDAPNGESFSTVEGGTSDIGAGLEKRSNPYYGTVYALASTPDISKVEYAMLNGTSNADFYLTSMERSLNRFSNRFTEKLYSSSFSCTPQAVTSSDDTITATVKFTMNDGISAYTDTMPKVKLNLNMTNPANGETLYTASAVLEGLTAGQEKVQTFTLNRSDMADGLNTTVSVSADILGMNRELASLSLVSVQDTGSADDEQQIDLMGNWYFNAYKPYKRNDTEVVALDKVENITEDVYTTWGTVQPGLGWWTSDFDASLGGNANYGGYAWYVRTFDLPENFPTEGLVMATGYFDEANEVYINGKLVGSTGMDYTIADGVGVYDGSNPWDTNCVYDLDSSVLNYGGKNTIAVRMCNSSGGGGWYEGPIGIYSVAAYNKAAGKPSVYASEEVKSAVLALAETQQAAIESEDLAAYKATLSADYFESGYNKERQAEKVAGWMENYDDIQVTDTGIGVFVDGDLYNYQADRVITGIDAEGNETEIYNGEVSEYYSVANGKAMMYGSHSRFFLDSYTSNALEGTEQTFRVYLPEGYFDGGNTERYQTLYLFHGINSTSKTYEIDDIDAVLDQAIASGEIEKMIVIIPDDPTKTSFWSGKYADMVTDDLVPVVDSRYRTIDDERYRFTSGCSMGGAGSVNIGLFHPNLFSGVISFYGALNYVDAVENAAPLSAEYLQQYAIWMACGNQDMYDFYDVQEQMSRLLSEKGVEHYHYIDIGTHASSFYLPLFVDSIQYVQKRMYRTDTSADVLGGTAKVTEGADAITVDYELNVSGDVQNYLNQIVNSEYTENTNPDLQIPVEITVTQGGVRVADMTNYYAVNSAVNLKDSVEIPAEDLDLTKAYTVEVYASALENTKLLQSVSMEADQQEDPTDQDQPGNPQQPGQSDSTDNPDTQKPDAEGNTQTGASVKTGDTAAPVLWILVAAAAGAAVIVAYRRRSVKK